MAQVACMFCVYEQATVAVVLAHCLIAIYQMIILYLSLYTLREELSSIDFHTHVKPIGLTEELEEARRKIDEVIATNATRIAERGITQQGLDRALSLIQRKDFTIDDLCKVIQGLDGTK